ncbi:MAG: peptidoglycan-binding protein LysM [Candidimonas sp.]|nr:MAG: peptidoglycan-binding protein LysM [Candidimonas sp.]
MSSHHPRVSRWGEGVRFLAAAGVFMLAVCAQAGAAELGHARIVSASGQPLKIDVPLVNLDAVEQSSLKVRLAPSTAWSQAGLTPPVGLDSLHVRVTYAGRDNARLIEVSSDQPFDGAVADLLLSVSSAEGEQQYQISILADMRAPGRPMLASGGRATGAAKGAGSAAHAGSIHVRRGDTMFAIAHRNAVTGVTVYQMMMALQRANPRAFIDGNVNLVKAGATLVVPDKAAMTAISDREARRLFVRQAAAFEAYRQRLAGGAMRAVKGASATRGRVSAAAAPPAPAAGTSQDRVILSNGTSAADRAADQKVATGKAVADAKQRITQLEKNVHQLDQALHGGSQGAVGATGAPGSTGAAGSAGHTGSAGVTGSGAAAASASAPAHGQRGTGSGAVASAGGNAPSGSGAAASSGAGASTAGGSTTGGVLPSPLAQAAANVTPRAPGGATANGSAGSFGAVTSASGAGHSSNAASPSAAAGSAEASSHGATAPSPSAPSSGTPPSGHEKALPGTSNSSGKPASASGAPAAEPSAGGNGAPRTASGESAKAGALANSSNEAGRAMNWIQDHMLGVVTAVLALIVLIIAWVLRRINAVRDDSGGSQITEAMVQEKLDQIDLDLRQPPDDAPTAVKD